MSPFMKNSFSSSINNSDHVFFGEVNCHKSSDGGLSWNEVNDWSDYYSSPNDKLHPDIPAIIPLIDKNGNEITLVCTDGGLYSSYDNFWKVTLSKFECVTFEKKQTNIFQWRQNITL